MKVREIILEAKAPEAPKPPNFVAKHAKSSGAGKHKDKKKAAKQGDVKHKGKVMAEGSEPNISTLDSVFNEHDFDRLEHIWPALEAGDKEEALRQINHYLRKGKNRAWWGDLQAMDIKIDPSDVENSQVMWSKPIKQGVAEAGQPMSLQQLATISDEALSKAYGYPRSSPGNTFGWQANLKSAEYAKKMIDAGVTDIEKISDAIHKGWNVTAQQFVQNPDQFDDTAKLKADGKLDAKLQQREKLMKIPYAQLSDDEQEKDRVVARALLQAITGQGVGEGWKQNLAAVGLAGLSALAPTSASAAPAQPNAVATVQQGTTGNQIVNHKNYKKYYNQALGGRDTARAHQTAQQIATLKVKNDIANGIKERVRDPEDWDEGNTEPGNNFAIYINGKKWKVFPGPYGAYADSPEEEREYYRLKDMARRKSEQTGKKWEVYKTGEKATESVNEAATEGTTNAGNVVTGAIYKNTPGKTPKNKNGTARNALDMKANLLSGGSIKR